MVDLIKLRAERLIEQRFGGQAVAQCGDAGHRDRDMTEGVAVLIWLLAVPVLDQLQADISVAVAVAKIDQGQTDVVKRFDTTLEYLKTVNTSVGTVTERVNVLESAKTVLAWKLGTVSAGAGAGLALGIQWLAIKIGVKL